MHEILLALAERGKLKLELKNETAVFWKRADDIVLAALLLKLTDLNVQNRCEALHDLGLLHDPRIYPPLVRACADSNEVVSTWSFRVLKNHTQVLRFAELGETEIEILLNRLSEERLDPRFLRLAASTGQPKIFDALRKLVETRENPIRLEALVALGRYFGAKATELALTLIKSNDPKTRGAAMIALWSSYDPAARKFFDTIGTAELVQDVYALAGSLPSEDVKGLGLTMAEHLHSLNKSVDTMVQMDGVFLFQSGKPHRSDPQGEQPPANLRSAKTAASVKALLKWVENGSRERAIGAIDAIALSHDWEALRNLAKRLGPERYALYLEEAIALEVIEGDPNACELLLASMGNDFATAPDVNGAAAENGVLDSIGGSLTIKPLLAALESSDPVVRKKASDFLSRFNDSGVIPLLLKNMKDASSAIRRSATLGLAAIDDPRAIPPLLDRWDTADAETRSNIAAVFGSYGDPRCVDKLLLALNDPDEEVRKEAVEFFGETSDNRYLSRLVHGAATAGPLERAAIADTLGKAHDSSMLEPLLMLLNDTDLTVRIHALQSVAKLQSTPGAAKDVGALKAMRSLLESDPAESVKLAAEQALFSVDPDRENVFIGLLQDANPSIRVTAAADLNQLLEGFFGRCTAKNPETVKAAIAKYHVAYPGESPVKSEPENPFEKNEDKKVPSTPKKSDEF